jgi:4-amino-4-deoxy-L-arabinose transferase-like glycosyltransferase
MKISNARLTLEKAIYIVVIFLAAWLRLGNLNKLPLTDSESVYALAAVSVTSEASPFWHNNEEVVPLSPAYHSLTALVFHLVGASEANARIIPALAGLMLVLTPLLARRRLGHSPTLLITFLFAISPVLLTTARTAGGTSLAALGIVAMIASLLGKEKGSNERLRFTLAGAAFGLALASGVPVFHGLLTLVLVALYLSITQSKDGEIYKWIRRDQFRWGIWIAVGVMIVVAIGFGFSFSGLAGLGEAFAEWVSGWGASVEMSPVTGLAILLIYEPLLLVFGIAGAVVALRNRDKYSVGAFTWAIGGILAMVVYPARQAADLVWVVIPLCPLAAGAGISLIERLAHRSSWLEFIGLIGFLLTLMTFTYLQFAAYASGMNLIPDAIGNGARLSIYLGLLLMGVVVIILFGLGWSWSLAGECMGFAGCIALLILTIAAGWRLNFAPTVSGANELWRSQVSTQGLRLMVETLETISQSYTGRTDATEVKVIGPATPSLAWALRNFRLANLSGEIMTNPVPVVLVRAGEEWPILEAQYTGQGLKIGEYWGWDGILPPNPIAWWIQRHAPTVEESWILFVRLDIISLGEMDWTGDEVVP